VLLFSVPNENQQTQFEQFEGSFISYEKTIFIVNQSRSFTKANGAIILEINRRSKFN